VVVAVVTSRLGVLIGRRRDGKPLWVFPGGKIDPGESPEETAVRETLEETGLRVRAVQVIGSRVHPVTGVLMVYVAAEPTTGPITVARESGELAEIRWVSVAEAEELMGGIASAVLMHLKACN
jgi:8-oxo-dGTP diphosphatase